MKAQVVIKPLMGYYEWFDDLIEFEAGSEYRVCIEIANKRQEELEQVALLWPATNKVYFSLNLASKY